MELCQLKPLNRVAAMPWRFRTHFATIVQIVRSSSGVEYGNEENATIRTGFISKYPCTYIASSNATSGSAFMSRLLTKGADAQTGGKK